MELYDIIICGGSLGGTIAAYSASKQNKKVLLLEETKWIGGQLTSQAVPPDEHRWIEEEGSTATYREYRLRVRKHYVDDPNCKRVILDKGELKNVNDMKFDPGSSEVTRIAHRPKLALELLYSMLEPYIDKNLTIITNAKLISCKKKYNKIQSVTYLINNELKEFYGKIFLDGTDTGELLPLSKTEYRIGAESKEETHEEHALDKPDYNDVQPITYPLAIKLHESGNYTIPKPKEYDRFRNMMMDYDKYPIFSMYGPDSSNGKARRFGMFYNEKDENGNDLFPLFVYRRIVCKDNYIDNKNINDITLLNWPQNDYFMGNIYNTDDIEKEKYYAKQLSLSFLYYLQTEVDRPDGLKGYPNFELLYDELGSDDGLSLAPYIRESRRIVSRFTITEEMIKEGSNPDFIDSVGVGHYPIDIHITTNSHSFFFIPSERFTIPLGSMIPIKTKNLIPACKNIGTTHLTNGSYRLHPIEWNIGEVAGYLASFVLDKNISVKDVYEKKRLLKEFQNLLIDNGIQLHWNK